MTTNTTDTPISNAARFLSKQANNGMYGHPAEFAVPLEIAEKLEKELNEWKDCAFVLDGSAQGLITWIQCTIPLLERVQNHQPVPASECQMLITQLRQVVACFGVEDRKQFTELAERTNPLPC